MKKYDHKLWLAFLQRASDLPLQYSVDELRLLKDTADAVYPSISPLIVACITLAQGSVEQSGSSTAKPKLPERQMHRNQVRSNEYAKRLMDNTRFPRNSDMISFAKGYLKDLPPYRFDKMARQRIANTLAVRLAEASRGTIKDVEADLGIKTDEDAAGFLRSWENTIKSS